MAREFDAPTTHIRDSSISPFASSLVTDLTVDFCLSPHAKQKLHTDVDLLQQHSIIIYVVGGRPNQAELCHLVQAWGKVSIERTSSTRSIFAEHARVGSESGTKNWISVRLVSRTKSWIGLEPVGR